MRKRDLRLLRQRENVRQLVLRIIEGKGYVISHDIADQSEIPLMSAVNLLLNNAGRWDLDSHYANTTIHGYSSGNFILAYTKRGEKVPERIDLSNYKIHRLPSTI